MSDLRLQADSRSVRWIRPTSGATCAGARRPQRAGGKRQACRLDAHRACGADHPRNRRQGRQGDPARISEGRKGSIRLPEQFAPAIADVPGGLSLSPPTASARKAAAIAAMQPGDILCLRTRAPQGRENNDPESSLPRRARRHLRHDAFSVAHRAHASVEGPGRASDLPAAPCRTSSRR